MPDSAREAARPSEGPTNGVAASSSGPAASQVCACSAAVLFWSGACLILYCCRALEGARRWATSGTST